MIGIGHIGLIYIILYAIAFLTPIAIAISIITEKTINRKSTKNIREIIIGGNILVPTWLLLTTTLEVAITVLIIAVITQLIIIIIPYSIARIIPPKLKETGILIGIAIGSIIIAISPLILSKIYFPKAEIIPIAIAMITPYLTGLLQKKQEK